ncbi:unnamed protein product [Ixodes persulcatus]
MEIKILHHNIMTIVQSQSDCLFCLLHPQPFLSTKVSRQLRSSCILHMFSVDYSLKCCSLPTRIVFMLSLNQSIMVLLRVSRQLLGLNRGTLTPSNKKKTNIVTS